MIGGIIMTQEEYESLKELMLKDLSARLQYGVIGQCEIDASYDTSFETKPQTHKFDAEVYGLLEEGLLLVTPLIEDPDTQEFANEEVADGVDILDFKPYLFPSSNMPDEALREYSKTLGWIRTTKGYSESELTFDSFDCVNKYHIDYRGFIEKGLAIDATGLNIY